MKTNELNSNPLCAAFLALGLCALLSACSSQPSAADGESAIQGRIKAQSDGRIKLNRYVKTNGQLSELMGVKWYGLEFECEIEFLENCRWLSEPGELAGFRTAKLPDQPVSETSQFMQDALNMVHGKRASKGQRVQLLGLVGFEKKEKGWALVEVKVTSAKPMAGVRGAAEGNGPGSGEPSKAEAPNSTHKPVGSVTDCFAKAQAGDPEAQYQVASMMFEGDHGLEQNPEEAAKWLRKSADQGLAKSQNGMGLMFVTGAGVDRDQVEAARWFRRAADQGYLKAQCNWGGMYSLGCISNVPSEAVNWVRKAADRGDADAKFFLGAMYFNGVGVEKDLAEGARWIERSAKLGHADAQWSLGHIYLDGTGVVANKEIAGDWFRKATNAARSKDRYKDAILLDDYESAFGLWAGVSRRTNICVNDLAAADLQQLYPSPAEIAKRQKLNCISNLKCVGLAFRMWSNDHQDAFPFNLSTSVGGTQELCSRLADGFDANSFLHYCAISNELHSPIILVCKSDSGKTPALNFQHLTASNVTYRVRSGPDVAEINAKEVLAACPIHGHTLHCDGSVSEGAIRSTAVQN